MVNEHFDLIVTGAGQGGGPIASAFTRIGQKTALVEGKYPGASCVNWGCIPTKALVASGRAANLAGRAADYGVHTGDMSIDMQAVRQRKRDIVETFRQGSRTGIESDSGLEDIEAEDTRLRVESEFPRQELEQQLRRRWIANGGTAAEFERERARLIRDAIAAKVLTPDEPADTTPVIDPSISKRRMLAN